MASSISTDAGARRHSVGVCLEVGSKRVFASALDWPGLSRSGRSEEDAVETLAAYSGRYRLVVERAGMAFAAFAPGDVDVIERRAGSATTDFGAPGAVADAEHRPVSGTAVRRQAALVEASWAVFDDVVAGAPAILRKGPRGGGRDRDAIVAHVLDAERSYVRKLRLRFGPFAPDDATSISDFRSAVVAAVRRPWKPGHDDPPWPPAYVARRMAWHVLDHAWEVEDRSEPGG